MPWYGHPENEAERANRLKHEAEHRHNRELEAQKEAARDPYRAKVSWNIGRRG
jgi:hypothetical protein